MVLLYMHSLMTINYKTINIVELMIFVCSGLTTLRNRHWPLDVPLDVSQLDNTELIWTGTGSNLERIPGIAMCH